MIKTFIQGEKDAELFSLVGKWLVAKEVQDVLGMAVTAEPGDVWQVFTDAEPLGFSILRPQKNNLMHLRFLYYVKQGAGEALVKSALKYAKENGIAAVHTNDRDTAKIWPRMGFAIRPQREHKPGHFIRWEREIK